MGVAACRAGHTPTGRPGCGCAQRLARWGGNGRARSRPGPNPQEALRAGTCRGGGNQLASLYHGKDSSLCAACSHCSASLGGPWLTSPRERGGRRGSAFKARGCLPAIQGAGFSAASKAFPAFNSWTRLWSCPGLRLPALQAHNTCSSDGSTNLGRRVRREPGNLPCYQPVPTVTRERRARRAGAQLPAETLKGRRAGSPPTARDGAPLPGRLTRAEKHAEPRFP